MSDSWNERFCICCFTPFYLERIQTQWFGQTRHSHSITIVIFLRADRAMFDSEGTNVYNEAEILAEIRVTSAVVPFTR